MTKKELQADSIEFGILSGSSNDYNYSDDVIDRLFFNNLDKSKDFASFEKLFLEDGSCVRASSIYKINSKFYRGEEFINNPEIIVSGCSFTYGSGLPDQYIWSNILSGLMNKKNINLGLPGKSVTSIINNLYSYFREYGHPEYVFCLFPSFTRFEMPINKKSVISKRNVSDDVHNSSPIIEDIDLDGGGYVQDIILNDEILSKRPKYSKSPHIIEDIITMDLTYWSSIKSILAFEQYCQVAEIKFVWTTWGRELDLALALIKDRYPKHYTSFIKLGLQFEDDCHEEESKKDPYLWKYGLDRERGIEYTHPGIHFNIHVAENFYKSLSIDENQ